jgi:hypothetical protein
MARTRWATRNTGAPSKPPLFKPKQSTLRFGTKNTQQLSKPKAQPGGSLLNLPPEIRLMIYNEMFPVEEFDIYAIRGSLHKAEHGRHVAGKHVAVLTACRTIYTEAKPVLYNNTEFCIRFRNFYWLHIWNADLYEESFEVEDYLDEPLSNEWIESNPWLEDPRSIVPVDNIRKLTLAIECNMNSVAHSYTWTAQIKHTLRTASNIQKLHISIGDIPEDTPCQHSTDRMLALLGQYIKCRGPVTAEMDLALGSKVFDSGSYYKMLDGFKGYVMIQGILLMILETNGLRVDKTYDIFSSRLVNLQSEHAQTVHQLRNQIRSLRSRTEDRVKFTEVQSSWTDYNIMKVVPEKLKVNINEVLNEMAVLEFKLQTLEKEKALLQRRFESLKVRSKE